jgi:hypothetical protein
MFKATVSNNNNVMDLIRKFNSYSDHIMDLDENNNPILKPTDGMAVSAEGSNIEERIAQLFSTMYRMYNTAFLGYQSYSTPDELESDDSLTDNQKVNSQFMVKLGKEQSETLFGVLKFHNRPLFCGVNVLYEPTVTTEFTMMHHNIDYFKGAWDTAYENTKYNGTVKEGAVNCRDLCFDPTFLGDMQAMANDGPELEMVFVRKGFSVGIGAVSAHNLTSATSIKPPMYGRVFENKWRDKVVAYSPVIMKANSKRTIPIVVENGTEIAQKIASVANNNCYFASPYIKDEDTGKEKTAKVESVTITKPSIIYVGEEIEGYSLFSYINIPVCSWKYFKSKSSGFGSGDDSNQTKVVQRLQNTQHCGPFMRVKAKGYYPAEVTEVLLGFSTIKVGIDANGKVIQYNFEPIKAGDQQIWGPPEGNFSKSIKDVAQRLWNERDSDSPSLRFLKYGNENVADRNKLYNNAYVRGDSNNPGIVNALFDEVSLPDRFSFFVCKNINTVCIAQFPCMPLTGAETCSDDYITQLVPLYRKITDDESIDETSSKTETIWYINDFDILVNRGTDGSRQFYNVNKQKPTLVTYPSEDSDGSFNDGFIYTCNGVVYSGPSYIPVKEDEKDRYGNYLKIDRKWVEMVEGGDYSKYENYQQYKKAAYIPDNIQGIILTTMDNDYISGPMGIAPYNYLDFMERSTSSNNAKLSRSAYKEFIKQGCVFMDGDITATRKNPVDEPSKEPAEFVPDVCGFAYSGNEIKSIEPDVENGVAEEPKPPQWINTVKIVVVVILALISIGVLVFITYKVVRLFKGKTSDIKCP